LHQTKGANDQDQDGQHLSHRALSRVGHGSP
jgi:hypothetical protein